MPFMATVRKVFHYLANLEWTEKKQHECKFCDRAQLQNVVLENDNIIAIDNRRSGGRAHWLIIPKQRSAGRHLRDIEALTADDLPLLQEMAQVKEQLLRQHFPNVPRTSIHCGYHRGRRHLVGPIILPDIVSIHHLHLHVIVEPRMSLRIFKYPSWFRFMWISDEKVMVQIANRKSPRMRIKHRVD